MGGINCDMSNGRTIGANVHRSDSDKYNRVLAVYSKSLFDGYKSFLAIQSRIEDVVISEDVITDALDSSFNLLAGSVADYKYKIDSLINCIDALEKAALKNFHDNEVIEFMKGRYREEGTEELYTNSTSAILIPSDQDTYKEVVVRLSDGAELSLIKYIREIISDLNDLNHKFSQTISIVSQDNSTRGFQLAIRELDTPVAPFSMKTQSLWIKLCTVQSVWALMNMHCFPSIDGVDTPIELMISSSR